MSDQWHSVASHRIILFYSHRSLTLGRTFVLLLSGEWWWARWRLGDIPWQCSRCPCKQQIQRHARVYPLFHGRKPCVLPVLLFRQSSSISFHWVQGCSICTCPFRVLVPGVSLQLFLSLCSMCLQWCCLFHKSSNFTGKESASQNTRLKFDLEKLKDHSVLETFQAMIGRRFTPLTIMNNEDTGLEVNKP